MFCLPNSFRGLHSLYPLRATPLHAQQIPRQVRPALRLPAGQAQRGASLWDQGGQEWNRKKDSVGAREGEQREESAWGKENHTSSGQLQVCWWKKKQNKSGAQNREEKTLGPRFRDSKKDREERGLWTAATAGQNLNNHAAAGLPPTTNPATGIQDFPPGQREMDGRINRQIGRQMDKWLRDRQTDK